MNTNDEKKDNILIKKIEKDIKILLIVCSSIGILFLIFILYDTQQTKLFFCTLTQNGKILSFFDKDLNEIKNLSNSKKQQIISNIPEKKIPPPD